jgi:hypothetical protein
MLRRVALLRTTRATLRNIPEDAILHSLRRENLKSSINLTVFLHGKETLSLSLSSIM